MSDSAEAISKRNAGVVRRYLRVFETKQVAESKNSSLRTSSSTARAFTARAGTTPREQC
ncbi:hypothetical protein ACWC09_36180 [Streptomyces sp. NPDC001617]